MVASRGWHGNRAQDSFEWHHRKEISKEFYRISDDKKARNGWMTDMDSVASYGEAVRTVRSRQSRLPDGYAHVYAGNKLVYSRGQKP